jgi:hypothetical protein
MLAVGSFQSAADAAERRPKLLLVMVDDMGRTDIGS